jgi:16S rRNA (cytidine1402-2'-O)-methyltransferase
MSGRLVLVSTPIGNLGDLSPRAVETLSSSALILCEDTRHSGKLLAHAGVRGVPLAVCNEHTETARVRQVTDLLGAGSIVSMVTDAGTPGISDPGARLVQAVIAAGHQVSAVPGPAALVMALVISGFDTTRFVFEGFIPRSGAARRERLAEIAAERRTVVLYEAPHRIAATIAALADICGPQRQVVMARELTKLHEESWRGSLGAAVAATAEREPRGEYVIVLAGCAPADAPDDDGLLDALRSQLAGGATRRDAVATVAAATGLPRRRIYDLALTI